MTQIKNEIFLFFQQKKLRRKKCFHLNYDVTKLHQVSLVELNFNQDKSDNRAGIFRFKNVL